MNIEQDPLCALMIELAIKAFGEQPFERRVLMEVTEAIVRRRDLWEPSDDDISDSTDRKSIGLANIDYRFSDLADADRLINIEHGLWRLPKWKGERNPPRKRAHCSWQWTS